MKYVPTAAIALMLAVPAFAQTTPATPAKPTAKAAAPKAAPAPATHATKGVVKSVDDGKLVITRAGGKSESTFVLNAATQRQGDIAVGASVDVRYHTEGKSKVATAVSVQAPKAPAAAKATK